MAKRRRGGTGTASTMGSGSEASVPDAERLISDVETLKALSDPLRLRILELMITRLDLPWTAKELAARLDVPQTRLYHHIELLVERDLVRIAEQHVVSGIIETRYRVAATTFRLDRKLVSGDASMEGAGRELLHTVFDTARDELARSLRARQAGPASAAADDAEIVNRGSARLTPARAAEFKTRIHALINEFSDDPAADDSEPWSLLVAFYRLENGVKEASHG